MSAIPILPYALNAEKSKSDGFMKLIINKRKEGLLNLSREKATNCGIESSPVNNILLLV